MNIVFMGTPDFAVESLKKIYESGHNILAVVSQPDKPSGRNMKLMPTPVKEYAESKNIKVYQPEKIRKDEELYETLKSLKPDVIVVVAFGQILPQKILDIPKYGSVNVHGSLLPKYRGAAPIQWAIISGEKVTGITTMYMDAGMDTGDMIQKAEVKIENDDNFGTLYEKMKIKGGELIVQTLEKIEDGVAPRVKQPDDFTLAPMIEKTLGNIDWNNNSEDIRNLVRGLNPTPGAYTNIEGQKIKIWRVEFSNLEKTDEVLPGMVIKANKKEGLLISTQDGILDIAEIQLPNSKRMLAKEYLNGHDISVNTICTM